MQVNSHKENQLSNACDDRGGERDPVVPGPRRSQRCPRSAEHFVGPLAKDPGGLRLDGPRIEQVNLPPARVGTLREHLAVHDRVGPGLIRRAALQRDVVGEVERARPPRAELNAAVVFCRLGQPYTAPSARNAAMSAAP